MTRFRHAQRVATLALVLLLPLANSAFAQAEPDDPIVADVVRMLEAGVEPGLVRSWLETGGKRPGTLSANDMIALAAASAPDELIEYLLESARQPVTPSVPAPATPPAATSAPAAPAAPAAEPVPPARQAAPATNAPQVQASYGTGDTDCCLVDFSVEYRASGQQYETQTDVSGGDLFLYIDGGFAGRFESQGNIAGGKARAFKRRLPPGRHVIRLTRERHAPSKNRSARDARDHQTTVSPSAISFDVQPGARWNMDIRWVQGVFSLNKPLSWRWSRNGEKVAGAEKVGADQDDWPFLCDDVELSRASGAISDWRADDRSSNCVTWASLWPDGVATDRAGILAGYRKDDFKPDVSTLGQFD